jgi:hypothetical protein
MSFYNSSLFPNFPATSKVWIYQADRFFDAQTAERIQVKADVFTKQWSAHKLQVNATGLVHSNLFLILVADESEVGVSGCSIDSSVHFIKEIEQEFELNFFDRLKIAYIDGGQLSVENAFELIQKINSGAINSELLVFNNTVQQLEELNTKWLVPIAESWLSKRIEKIPA